MEFREMVNQIKSMTGNPTETRVRANSVKVMCPCHTDRTPSLQVTDNKDSILMKCHAGCDTKDILATMGLGLKDLYKSEMPVTKDAGTVWNRMMTRFQNQYGKGVHIQGTYNYTDADGNYQYTKLRLEGGSIDKKTFVIRVINEATGTYKTKKPEGCNELYRLPEVIKAVKERRTVYFTEGEKDVETLRAKGYIATTSGSASSWQADFAQYFKGADVVILPDNDEPGEKFGREVLNGLTGVAERIRVVKTSETPKGDVTDYFTEGHTVEEFEDLVNNNTHEVRSMLSYRETKGGEIRINQTVRNHEIILENDNRFSGKIKFDEFSRQTFLAGCVSWEGAAYQARPWNVTDDCAAFALIQTDYGLNNRTDFSDALRNVSYRRRFHPVKEVLEALPYKGDGYIRKLLPKYLGAEDSEYNFAVMKLFMLGAVSRVYEPGCKFDYMPILKGDQGIGKSTFLAKLALSDAWFSDSLDSLDGDKAAMSLAGVWILELGELKSFNRTSGTGAVKRFISATQDRYRIPYERRAETFPRQCVFAGSVNQENFLQDETGNRRFLIVKCGVHAVTEDVFSEAAAEDIKAAWAEALNIYKTEKPMLVLPRELTKEANELQGEAMEDDGTEGVIEDWLERYRGDKVCSAQVWREALEEEGWPQRWQTTRINNILARMPDWEKVVNPLKFEKYGNQRGFRRLRTTIGTTNFENVDTEKEDCPYVEDPIFD